MTNKQSKTVFKRRCQVCGMTFSTTWRTTRFCSGTCRQRVCRARRQLVVIDEKIEEARKRYWALVRKKEIALGAKESKVPSEVSAPPRRKRKV